MNSCRIDLSTSPPAPESLTAKSASAAGWVERRFSICALALSLLLLGAAPGCDVNRSASFGAPRLLAQVQLGRERVFVGERFMFRVRVVGSVRPDAPDTSVLRDFDVEYIRRNDHASRRETIFHYFLQARRAGTIEIPPIPIFGGGSMTKTAPARIEARLPENPRSFRLHVEPERETVYVGQQVFVRFAFEYDAEAENIRFQAPFLEDERFVAFLAGPPFRRLPDGYQRVPVNRGMTAARVEPASEKGRNVLRFAAVVIPQRAGRIPVGSASAAATIRSSTDPAAGRGEARVVLDSPTAEIRGDGEQRGFVYSEPMSLVVRELPQAGALAEFTGLVGRYEVTTEIVPRAITFGDPLELAVSLSGQPYLAGAAIPDLRNNTVLLKDFEVRRATEFSALVENRKVFRYDLRPRRSGALTIPPIPFSYFDPDSGQYVSARSAALDVPVEENRVVTVEDAEGATAGNSTASLSGSPLPDSSQAAADRSGMATARDGAAAEPPLASATVASVISTAVGVLRSPVVVGGIVVPPLIVLLVWLVRRVARRRPWRGSAPVELSPFALFESEFAKQGPFGNYAPQQMAEASPDAAARSAAFALFRQYLGLRLGIAGSSMTFGDVGPELRARGVSPGLIARIGELFAAADAARYGGGPVDGREADPLEVRRLVLEIERDLSESE